MVQLVACMAQDHQVARELRAPMLMGAMVHLELLGVTRVQ